MLGLGLSPRAVARTQAQADGLTGPAEWRQAAMDRVLSDAPSAFPDRPLPSPAEPEAFAEAVFDQLWDHRRLGRVRDIFCPAARMQAPGNRQLFGHGEITGWATGLIGSFGDARFRVDHVAAVDDETGQDIAVRWEMAGTHDGPGLYGPPTGRPVYILGVTHWRVAHGRITDEVTVFDEVALLRQIEGGL